MVSFRFGNKLLGAKLPIMTKRSNAMSATALWALSVFLRQMQYHFITATPLTHHRVNGRPGNERAKSVFDVFGWSRPFAPQLLPERLFDALVGGGILVEERGGWRSLIRASSVEDDIFFHSAYPTKSSDAVFFGPDTYRFARAIKAHLTKPQLLRRGLDLGCGSGAGGVVLAKNSDCHELVLSDINDKALQLAGLNAESAGLHNVKTVHSDLFEELDGEFDFIVANPPYLNDVMQRTYRHGGGELGSELSRRIAFGAKTKLAQGGTLLLYTGSPIVSGLDRFQLAIEEMFSTTKGFSWSYEQIDPDVFGEELERDTYAHVDRIAAVLLTVKKIEAPQC
jgi:methylase of polypeptide subunit release factors